MGTSWELSLLGFVIINILHLVVYLFSFVYNRNYNEVIYWSIYSFFLLLQDMIVEYRKCVGGMLLLSPRNKFAIEQFLKDNL